MKQVQSVHITFEDHGPGRTYYHTEVVVRGEDGEFKVYFRNSSFGPLNDPADQTLEFSLRSALWFPLYVLGPDWP